MKQMALGLAALALLAVAAGPARADPVVSIFSGFTPVGGGTPYSGFVGSFTSPDVMFATNTGYNWHPFGQVNFGADIRGELGVAATGTYTFTLNSDDGSQLFIDGSLVVDDGNPHSPTIVSNSVALAAGSHHFEVQFFECCGGPSGVDLTLPAGVNFVPEPASLSLFGIGGLGMLGYARWRRSRRPTAVAAP